jgi:hypothetical protein
MKKIVVGRAVDAATQYITWDEWTDDIKSKKDGNTEYFPIENELLKKMV